LSPLRRSAQTWCAFALYLRVAHAILFERLVRLFGSQNGAGKT
jgi:hypothetical protein